MQFLNWPEPKCSAGRDKRRDAATWTWAIMMIIIKSRVKWVICAVCWKVPELLKCLLAVGMKRRREYAEEDKTRSVSAVKDRHNPLTLFSASYSRTQLSSAVWCWENHPPVCFSPCKLIVDWFSANFPEFEKSVGREDFYRALFFFSAVCCVRMQQMNEVKLGSASRLEKHRWEAPDLTSSFSNISFYRPSF